MSVGVDTGVVLSGVVLSGVVLSGVVLSGVFSRSQVISVRETNSYLGKSSPAEVVLEECVCVMTEQDEQQAVL